MPDPRKWLQQFSRSERSAVLSWVWDAQAEGAVLLDADGRVMGANAAASAMLGVPEAEMLGTTPDDPLWRRVTLPDGRPVPGERRPGAPRPRNAAPLPDQLLAIRVPERSPLMVRARNQPRWGPEGLQMTLIAFADVTAEAGARRTIERVTESVDEVLFTAELGADGQLHLAYISPGAARLVGGPPAEGESPELAWFRGVHPDDRPLARRAVRDTAAGRPVTLEYRTVDPTGEVCWVRVRTRRREEGSGVHLDGVITDITEARDHEQEMARLAREHEAIGNLATAIAAGTERDAVFTAAAREAARMVDAEAGGVWRTGSDGGGLLAGWPISDEGRTELREAVALLDGAALPAQSHQLTLEHGACLAAPVVVEGTVWGAVVACRAAADFGPPDAHALDRLAGLVGTAVGLAHARDVLVHQASTDGLTGLCNHRTFHDLLRAETLRARRYGRPLTIVLVDLDEFKEVNDADGHQAGDTLLRAVAGALQDVVRGSETVARLGGDEFAVLLPETDLAGAQATAERVREAIALLPDAQRHGVTASAGVADLDQASSVDDLIGLADGALYWSKAHGRNQVSTYDPQRADGVASGERTDRLVRGQALNAVRVLARVVDERDRADGRHGERVAALATSIAAELGWSQEHLMRMQDAALLHDVGRLAADDDPGAQHALAGARIAAAALDDEQARWIAQHHERWDGSGGPAALTGADLALGGRILALAEAWDEGFRDPGGDLLPGADALEAVRAQAGRAFCPDAVAALEAAWTRGAVG